MNLRTILFLVLPVLCFGQAAKTPALLSPPAPASVPAAAPEKRPLSPEAKAQMKAIERSEVKLEMKIQELIGEMQSLLQVQRNQIWAAECKAAGWIKNGECQVDATADMIAHVVQSESAKPEQSTAK